MKNSSKVTNKTKTSRTLSNKLYRSTENKIIAGVCGGIGEYFSIDPVLVRIVFVLLFLYSGSGLLIYLILWLIIPKKESHIADTNDTIKSNFKEMRKSAEDFMDEVKIGKKSYSSKQIIGFFLVILGIAFLLDNFGIVVFDHVWRLWPIVLIVVGFIIVFKHEKK